MDTDVVVVGAGAAGLAAALWLAERSAVRVIVVEGRDRIGGRVRWETVGTSEVPAELGAEFIHGPAPETSAFLRGAGLTRVETGGDSWTYAADGVLRPSNDEFELGDIFERARSLPHDESIEAFIKRFEGDPSMAERVRRTRLFVEGFEAADPALASVYSIADEVRSGVDSTSTRPVGSYAPLFDYLANRCARAGIDVRLATTVERITWTPADVTVETRSSGGGSSTIRARAAIVTVPVGVLHQGPGAAPLSFEPPLPPEKREALRNLVMGHAVRVTLSFRTPFWEEVENGRYRDAAFFRRESGSFNAFWAQLPIRGRTIVAWGGGPRATAMATMTPQERIDRARDEFGAMFGHVELARDVLEAGVTHDWSSDPFACGAYSYVGVGGGVARATLGKPAGDTLFFAGEATSVDGQGGTVSGAFGSGMRAAREAAAALHVSVPPQGQR